VHEVLGSLVDVDVLLDGGGLGVTLDFAAAIHASEQPAESPVHKNLNDGVVNVEDHSGDDDITDGAEPDSVEVGKGTGGEAESKRLLGHVGVDHQEEEGRVEELHDEGDGGGLGETLGLSGETNPVNKHDTDGTEDIVDTDEEVRKAGGHKVDGGKSRAVVGTDGLTFGLTVGVLEVGVLVILEFLLAEALESSGGGLSWVGLNEVEISNGVGLELITIGELNTITVNGGEDGCHVSGLGRDNVDNNEGAEEQDANDSEGEKLSEEVVSRGEVTVLPDDIGGLRAGLEDEVLVEEGKDSIGLGLISEVG